MSEISDKQIKISDYLFLIEKIDDIKKVNSLEYFKKGYEILGEIRAGEDYLFFHMKDSIDDELVYYSKNLKELDEIIEILDAEYAIAAYHDVIKSIIDTKFYIDEGKDLEFALLETEETDDEGKTEICKAIYTLPSGTIKELKMMKEASKKPKENFYI